MSKDIKVEAHKDADLVADITRAVAGIRSSELPSIIFLCEDLAEARAKVKELKANGISAHILPKTRELKASARARISKVKSTIHSTRETHLHSSKRKKNAADNKASRLRKRE